MKKILVAVVLASALVGLDSSAQATHWTKDFWEQQARQSGG